MGVWIETKAGQPITATELESHPVWVCGLKRKSNLQVFYSL